MTIVEAVARITGGVDTHRDVHVAAALDPLGGLLGTESFCTDPAGYKALLSWLEDFGTVTKIGVEGTGSSAPAWPATCAVRVSRSSRSTARIARSVAVRMASPTHSTPSKQRGPLLVGRASGKPKSRDGAVEAIRVLVVAKRSARQARGKAIGPDAPPRLQRS